MNMLIPQTFGQISTRFAEVPVENTLSANIPASFAVIGFKGKVWSVRYRGETTHIMAENNRDPAGSLELVVFKSAVPVSKTFYEKAYVEGSNDPPDCMSMNGLVPEANVPKKQAPECSTCPNNQWGSRLTPDGKKAKACADGKRLAVGLMPLTQTLTAFGPALLRVPPTSLQDLSAYGDLLAQHGYPEHALVTRVSFDMKEAYPRFQFQAVRALTDGEADAAIDLRASPEVARILAEALEFGAVPEGESQSQQPPAQPAVHTQPVRPAPRTTPGTTPPRTGVVRTLTLPSTVVAPTAPSAPAPDQATPTPVQAVPASPVPPVSEDGIPAFLRKGEAATPSEEDEPFLDEIDAKLAAMLPS